MARAKRHYIPGYIWHITHPSMWPFSGYNEIQEPRRKNVLIDYERLQGLLGAGSYEQLRNSYKGWVEEYLGDGEKARNEQWTGSIAVGSRPFVEKVKALLGFRAKGREVIEAGEDIRSGRELLHITLFSGLKKRI